MKARKFLMLISVCLFSTGFNKYYVSNGGCDTNDGLSPETAWESLEKVNNAALHPGDSICFRCGDVFRGYLKPISGTPDSIITYCSFGTGPKPVIEPSIDASSPESWTREGRKLWKFNTVSEKELANVIFNHGQKGCGYKVDRMNQLQGKDLRFVWVKEDGVLFLVSRRNPARRFRSIEIALKQHVVSESKCHDVCYDGLHLRYGGAHGIGGGGVRRITVRNCDVCWIGGSTQYVDNTGSSVRYGNGIEFWGSAEDILVEKCRIWECWDAGLTNQSNVDSTIQRNIVYRDNKVWNCEYSYEYWQQGKGSCTRQVVLENNSFRNAGYGWSHSRRWNPNAAHLMMYDNTAETENFVIRGNTFSRSRDCIIRLFNAWYPSVSAEANIWKPGRGIICRYHGRPVRDIKYRYPNHLDEVRDDNEVEIQSQTAEKPDVFSKGRKELQRFLERFDFDRKPRHGNIPEGVKFSGEYSVKVKVGGRWKEVPAVFALTADGTGNKYRIPDEIFEEFGGIRKSNKVASCAVVSVASEKRVKFKICFLKTGQVRIEKLKPGEKRIVCPDGDSIHCVVISVDGEVIKRVEEYPHRMIFARGYHTIDNNAIITADTSSAPIVNIPDSTVVIIEEGAHVCAAFNIEGAKHVRICGNGYINQLERCAGKDCDNGVDSLGAFRRGVMPSVYIHRGSSDISIEGIKIISDFRGICGRCSKDIDVSNVVVMTSSANGDGINFANCTGCMIENSLVHSEDDCLAIFNNCDSIHHLWDEDFDWPAVCSGITMRGCILWTACRPFCIGGHGTGTRLEDENIIEDVVVENCIVAGQANTINADWSENTINYRKFWSGGFRILSQSNQTVRNVSFKDIVYKWTPGYNGQPIHICVRDSSKTSYTETGGWRIENVLFENISFVACNPQRLPVYVKAPEVGDGSGREISGVTFKNVTFDGEILSDADISVEGAVNSIYAGQ